MEHICRTCYLDNTSHSCYIIKHETDVDIEYVYTCPSEATKIDDAEGVVIHYDNILSSIKNKWIYVCDCENFGLKHALAINTATSTIKLINNKYSHNLIRINIINSNSFIHITLKVVWPFLNDELKKKLYIDNKPFIK